MKERNETQQTTTIRRSISYKISMQISICFCVSFLVLFIIIFQSNYRIFITKDEQMFTSYLNNTMMSLDAKIKDMGRESLMSVADEETVDILIGYDKMDSIEQRQAKLYLESFFTSLSTLRNDIQGIYMFNNESLIFYYDVANPSVRKIENEISIVEQLSRLEHEQVSIGNCYLLFEKQPWFMKFSGYYCVDPYYMNSIWMVRDLYSFSPYTKIGSIVLTIPIEKIRSILESTIGTDMFYLLMTKSGKVVCSQNGEYLLQNMNEINPKILEHVGENESYTIEWEGKQCLIMNQTSECSDLILITGKPKQCIYFEVTRFMRAYVILCICTLIITVVVTSLDVNRVIQPIKQLAKDMARFDYKILNVRYPVTTQDETGQLMSAFNSMMDMLDNLIEKQYKAQVQIQKGLLKEQNLSMLYLKSQVNPHFLYNTLDTIRIRAEINQDKDVSYMLMRLVDFFRLSVKIDNPVVTLEHEIDLIQAYLTLMCYRYPKIRCEYDIDPLLMEIEVPNFILQPIIENSILHGLRDKGYDGIIKVSVVQIPEDREYVRIDISDDGIGFDEDVRNKVNKMLSEYADNEELQQNKTKSVGIINVQSRLKMFYSNECGLTYTENEYSGVTAHILVKDVITYDGLRNGGNEFDET